MSQAIKRRDWLKMAATLTATHSMVVAPKNAIAAQQSRWSDSITKGLDWLSRTQSSRGQWNTQVYPTAVAALAQRG